MVHCCIPSAQTAWRIVLAQLITKDGMCPKQRALVQHGPSGLTRCRGCSQRDTQPWYSGLAGTAGRQDSDGDRNKAGERKRGQLFSSDFQSAGQSAPLSLSFYVSSECHPSCLAG